MNLSFVLPALHLNIHKTEKMLQFGTKNSRAWQEVKTKLATVMIKSLTLLSMMDLKNISQRFQGCSNFDNFRKKSILTFLSL